MRASPAASGSWINDRTHGVQFKASLSARDLEHCSGRLGRALGRSRAGDLLSGIGAVVSGLTLPASYCRDRAEHSRRVASRMHQLEIREMLAQMARDYDDIAEDLENGAIEIRHPELMPQQR
jgi:hypothetical protein